MISTVATTETDRTLATTAATWETVMAALPGGNDREEHKAWHAFRSILAGALAEADEVEVLQVTLPHPDAQRLLRVLKQAEKGRGGGGDTPRRDTEHPRR